MIVSSCVAAPPAPKTLEPGTEACLGLSEAICQAVVQAISAGRGSAVDAYWISCDVPSCTTASGSLNVVVRWPDGTTDTSGFGWGNGFDTRPVGDAFRPIPTPPVPPTCLGVEATECTSRWRKAMENLPESEIGKVVGVILECTSPTIPCPPTAGSGRMTLVFRDGSSRVESTWQYSSEPVSP
jgi:hypothetical protein